MSSSAVVMRHQMQNIFVDHCGCGCGWAVPESRLSSAWCALPRCKEGSLNELRMETDMSTLAKGGTCLFPLTKTVPCEQTCGHCIRNGSFFCLRFNALTISPPAVTYIISLRVLRRMIPPRAKYVIMLDHAQGTENHIFRK